MSPLSLVLGHEHKIDFSPIKALSYRDVHTLLPAAEHHLPNGTLGCTAFALAAGLYAIALLS